jgi:hypothetical protein
METYSIANGLGTAPDSDLVAGWDGKDGKGWWRAWALAEVRTWTPVDVEIWRHGEDPADPEVYVLVNGSDCGLCLVECPSMPDALRCVAELMPLANTSALTEAAGYLEELVGLTKALFVDRGIPLPR